MTATSAAAQIASSVKNTLDGYPITRLSQLPTIRSVKTLTMELCNMAAAVESVKSGGKYGHLYLILSQAEYRLATSDTSATVDLLKKPDEVNPKFKTETKEALTRYRILQLEAETKETSSAYITQEEVSKEIGRRMVASIEPEFIEELKNEYTGYTNETPKSFLAHLAKEYCAATIDDKLNAVREFEHPWDQVVTMSAWITRLELLRRKCTEAGVDIDEARMVLTITSNAMKCPLFTQLDHENYDDLTTKSLTNVKAYWVKKYKAHKKFNRDQSATNEYESAAFTVQPPSVVSPTGGSEYDTYVSALENVIARQLVDREDALTVNTTAQPTVSLTEIMAAMKKEMTAMLASMATSNTGGGNAGGGGGDGGGGRRRRKGAYGKDAEGNDLPKCPHCNRPAVHKPEDCFSLPANAEKMKKANFVDGKFAKKPE